MISVRLFIFLNPQDWRGAACGGLTFPECLVRGPGERVLHAESIGWVSPFPRRFALLPQKAAGPGATRRIAPTRNRPEHKVQALCPPVPWNQRRLMVSARNILAPGPGNSGKAGSL